MAISKIELDEDKSGGYCTACSGSGEGQYDGSYCPICKGSGELHEQEADDFDPPDVYLEDY